MDKEEKINQLEKLQEKINNVKIQMEELENDFLKINCFDINDKLTKQKAIIDRMNDVIIDNDDEYIKIRVHKMKIDKLLRCDIYEDVKYFISKIIMKYNLII